MPHAAYRAEQPAPQLEQLFDYNSSVDSIVVSDAPVDPMTEDIAPVPLAVVEDLPDGSKETTVEQEERIADIMEKRGCGRKMAELAVLGRPKSVSSDNRQRTGKKRTRGRNNDGSIDRRTLSPRVQARADHPGDWAVR